MKKTRVLSLMLILAMALSLTLSAAAYADGEKNDWRGIEWERDSLLEALFITGVGVLPVEQPMPWQVDAARTTAICFDSGVTDIPAGFTAGCVNMKTVMIPASVRSIGQGVLAISGGLKDVYYQGTLEGLLSIQMFPEDRAALNGARFHESKIIYDITGEPFNYVPVEKGQEGTIKIVDDGQTVTGTLSDGTTYTIVYGENGEKISQEVHSDNIDYKTTYHYRPDGTLEWTETPFTHKEYGEGILKEYYAADGKTKTKREFTADSGSIVTDSYYSDGKTIKETVLDSNDGGNLVRTYREDGTLEKTKSWNDEAPDVTDTKYFNQNGAKTKETITYPDGATRDIEYAGPKNSEVAIKQTTTRPNGNVLIEEFSDGKLVKKTDINNTRTLITEYDGQGNIAKQTLIDSANNIITQEIAADGSKTQTTEYAPGQEPAGKNNSYTGEKMTKEILRVDSGNNVINLEYEYERGTTVTIEYSNGKPTVETDVFAPGTQDNQTGKGLVRNVTNFDENGQPVSATAYLDDNSYYTEAYDSNYNLVHTEYSPEGKKTYEAVNDYMGNKVNEKFFNEDGSWTQIDYDGGSTITRYFDKDGNETTATGSPIVP